MAPASVPDVRKIVNGLRLPGPRRLHFKQESDSRRRVIISAMCALDLHRVVYDAANWSDQKAAWDACIRAVVDDCGGAGAELLVIERDDSVVHADRLMIRAQALRLAAREHSAITTCGLTKQTCHQLQART